MRARNLHFKPVLGWFWNALWEALGSSQPCPSWGLRWLWLSGRGIRRTRNKLVGAVWDRSGCSQPSSRPWGAQVLVDFFEAMFQASLSSWRLRTAFRLVPSARRCPKCVKSKEGRVPVGSLLPPRILLLLKQCHVILGAREAMAGPPA